MEKLHTKDVDALFEAILSLETLDECYKFFEDACTIKEILDIAQRLKAAKMLKAGKNYVEVCTETGMSSATISRVSRCLEYGAGGYELAIKRLAEKEDQK
jgi:TrpR-related protein YerC/YecD